MSTEEWNPGKLLGLSGCYWNACTLQAGVKLGIFTILRNRVMSAREVARKLKGDPRAVAMLLNALAAMHLLIKKEDNYRNTETAATWLSKGSPNYIGFMIMHHHHLLDSWARLDQAVLSGRPVRTRASFDDKEVRESFLMGMFNMAMMLAPRMASAVDLTGRSRLLDLGGGPGTYAIHFCLQNPRLKATIYDLSTTRPFAQKTIRRFGLSDRVHFQSGDYLSGKIKGAYDAVWLSQILHGEGPEDCLRIIQKAVAALIPGGLILVHEFLLNDDLAGPLFPAIFSLNMLLGTPHGQSYSEGQIKEMLAGAGIREIRRLALQTPNDSGIIQGIR